MTLSRQLLLIMLAVLLLAFGGTFLIVIDGTRQHLNRQLEAHARSAASSLGASLSSARERYDSESLEATVDAVFEGGGYLEILVASADSERVVHRSRGFEAEGVPQWFVDAVPLLTPSVQALIAAPERAGRVSVISNPADAYQALWRSAVDAFRWSMVGLAFGTLLMAAGLRHLLRPLAQVEAQARAITEQRLDSTGRTQTLPAARELRRVLVAMRLMSDKVHRMLNEQLERAGRLREDAYVDPATGSANRRNFEQRLAHMLGAPDEHAVGALLLVRLRGLEVLERTRREARDEFVRAAAAALRDRFEDGDAFVARIGEGEFGVLMSAADVDAVSRRAEQVLRDVAGLRHADVEGGVGAHIGVSCTRASRSASELLGEAEAAVRQAQACGLNQWRLFGREEASARVAVHGSEEWRTVLRKAMNEGGLVLMYQAVESLDLESVTHYEVLARIRGKGESLVAAGVFMPMAERLGLASALDRVIVETVIEDLSANGADDARYAINLSQASLAKERFRRWLCKKLARANGLTERLAFEVPEHCAHRHPEAARELSTRLRGMGARFGVDHFGMGAPSFAYLHGLPLDYVKIDGSYINGLDRDPANRSFVRALVDIARLLDIDVIAEFVETASQLHILRELGVNGVQGYFVVKPEPRVDTGRPFMDAGAA